LLGPGSVRNIGARVRAIRKVRGLWQIGGHAVDDGVVGNLGTGGRYVWNRLQVGEFAVRARSVDDAVAGDFGAGGRCFATSSAIDYAGLRPGILAGWSMKAALASGSHNKNCQETLCGGAHVRLLHPGPEVLCIRVASSPRKGNTRAGHTRAVTGSSHA